MTPMRLGWFALGFLRWHHEDGTRNPRRPLLRNHSDDSPCSLLIVHSLSPFLKTHWYQNWYQSGFLQKFSNNNNPHNSLELYGIKLEAGVRIELTIGVLQFVVCVPRRSPVFLSVPLNRTDPENCPKSGTRWNTLKHE